MIVPRETIFARALVLTWAGDKTPYNPASAFRLHEAHLWIFLLNLM